MKKPSEIIIGIGTDCKIKNNGIMVLADHLFVEESDNIIEERFMIFLLSSIGQARLD